MADIDDIVSAALQGSKASGPERARADKAWAAARTGSAAAEAAVESLIATCRRDGWVDTARAVLAALGDRFAGAEWRLLAGLWLAEQRRDHAGSLVAAQALSVAVPQNPAGPIGVATALAHMGRAADADRAIQAAQAAFPGKLSVWQAAAEIADLRSDVTAALERWQTVRTKFPESSAGYTGALRTLREANRLDQAPAMLAAGLEAFPEDRELLAAAARTAESAQNVEQAHKYWQRLVELVPGNPRYALMAALSLMGGRVGRAKRLPEILQRLDQVHANFPDFAPAYAAHLDCLVSAGRLDEAERLAPDWHARFPDHADIALSRAHIAAERGRPEEAVLLIEGLRAQVPATPAIEGAYIKALSAAGALDRAEAVCVAAMSKFPGARRLLSEYARLATRRGDWQAAQARLQDALRQWPADAGLAKELLHARIQLAGQIEAENAAPPAEGDAALFAQFESLGGSFLGCEFGTVQRSFGTESLGLLRWTRITADELIGALRDSFQDVGSEETTVLKIVRNASNIEEYVTSDNRFGMKSNTFMKVSDAPFDKMFTQTCRRLRFLRGRMLEDLRLAEKIFVFKAFHPLADGKIRQLHEAIRTHGDGALLCVMKADADHAKGTVRRLANGLYVGYVGFFMKDADKNPGSDRASWHAVCSAAAAHFQQDRALARIDAAA
jgi:tetratricopeptide (TPR) repeat protein